MRPVVEQLSSRPGGGDVEMAANGTREASGGERERQSREASWFLVKGQG